MSVLNLFESFKPPTTDFEQADLTKLMMWLGEVGPDWPLSELVFDKVADALASCRVVMRSHSIQIQSIFGLDPYVRRLFVLDVRGTPVTFAEVEIGRDSARTFVSSPAHNINSTWERGGRFLDRIFESI